MKGAIGFWGKIEKRGKKEGEQRQERGILYRRSAERKTMSFPSAVFPFPATPLT